jgi:hypothetical protein
MLIVVILAKRVCTLLWVYTVVWEVENCWTVVVEKEKERKKIKNC